MEYFDLIYVYLLFSTIVVSQKLLWQFSFLTISTEFSTFFLKFFKVFCRMTKEFLLCMHYKKSFRPITFPTFFEEKISQLFLCFIRSVFNYENISHFWNKESFYEKNQGFKNLDLIFFRLKLKIVSKKRSSALIKHINNNS